MISRLKSPGLAGLFLFTMFLMTGCPSGAPKYSTKPVVQVNGHSLSSREFATRLARRLKDLDAITAKDPATIENAKNEIVKDFIVQSLIIDWVRSKDIKISDSDLDKEVERIRSGYPDDLTFRRALAEQNLSFSEWRESLLYSLIEKAFFAKLGEKIKPPSNEEIKKYFEDNRDQFRKKERIYLRQILVDEESKAELMKTESKTRDFAELAKKYSKAPEAKNGGLVGWVEKGTVDFFDPAFSQSIGSVSGVVKSPFGYHLLKVEKKLPASAGTFDEARPEIVRSLMAKREQSEFINWLDGQIRSAKVLKDEELIRAIRVETRSTDE